MMKSLRCPFHLCAVLLLLVAQPLSTATIVVRDACTLSDAIHAANSDVAVGGCTSGSGADTLSLTQDVVLTTIDNLNNGLPQIASQISVDGNGNSVSRDVDAPGFRFFEVLAGASLELVDVTLAGGLVNASPDDDGGAILNRGTLELRDTTVTGNESRGSGGGIFNDDATTVSIVGSTISNNAASAQYGGGIYSNFGTTTLISDSTISGNYSSFDGGGIFAYEGVTVVGSTISGNSTFGSGGGIGMRYTYDTTTITDSVLSNNTASSGGAFYNGPGSTLIMTNVTLSGNDASNGGGLYQGFYGSADLSHVTLAANSPNGVSAESGTLAGVVNLNGSVLASNSGPNCAGEGVFNDGGGNFDDDGSCPGASLVTGLDPLLADNGGPTLTHALLPGSSAVDAAGACGLPTDQRGFGRDADCDSGAFELDAAPAVLGQVAGLEPELARCSNLTDGSSVAIQGGTSWNCRIQGLAIESGDRVLQQVRGQTIAPTFTGVIEGLDDVKVRCQNFTSGEVRQFVLAGSTSFDCRAKGLPFAPGNSVGWSAIGNAQ